MQCCAVAHGGPSAPDALILLAQNAVALVAEPSPVIRQVTEWLQTVSPLARSYILLNTPNDGPARRRGTRDPTGSQGVCRPARACLETAENTGATVPYSARVSQASTNSRPVILQTEIPSNTARLQRGSRDGPAPFIYKTAYNAEFAGKFTANRRCQFSPQILPSGAKTDSRDSGPFDRIPVCKERAVPIWANLTNRPWRSQ